jgi:hypothetical protein
MWVRFDECHKLRSDYLGYITGDGVLHAKSDATLPPMLLGLNMATLRMGEWGCRYDLINYKLDGDDAMHQVFLVLKKERDWHFPALPKYS